MGTTHGAEELGSCGHMGLPAKPTPEVATIGLCLRYGHIWTKIKSGPAGKGKMYNPIGLRVEESKCSVVAEELPPGIALGRCEEMRGVADGLSIAGETTDS